MILDPDSWNVQPGVKVRVILACANIVFFYWLFTSFTWSGLGIGFFGYLLVAKIGGDIGVHRYFTHRSFVAKRWAHWLFLILSVPVSFGSAMGWSAAHRLHHDKSDEPEDPHSPKQIGCLRVWLLMLGNKWHANPKYVKDLMRDKGQLFFHRNYFKLYAAWVLTLGCIAYVYGWQWFVYLWALPVTLEYHASSAVNVICHKWGYQSYKTGECSTNNIWLNFILLGNAMHNNHHGKPASYTLAGDKWYEFDIWAYLVKYVFMEKK